MKYKLKLFFQKIFFKKKLELNNFDVIFAPVYTYLDVNYLQKKYDYEIIISKEVEYINAYENTGKLLLVKGNKFKKSKDEALKEFNAYK